MSLAGTDGFSTDRKGPETEALSYRGSLDKRSKQPSPCSSRLIIGKESALVLKKLPKALKVDSRDVVPPKKLRIEQKAAPLRIIQSRKIGGASSALALQHPSPRDLGSFVSAGNMSGSKIVELTRNENKKNITLHQKVQHQQQQIRRETESQPQSRITTPGDHYRAMLNIDKQKRALRHRVDSDIINATDVIPKKKMEKVKSTPKIPILRSNEQTNSSKLLVKNKVMSAVPSPRPSTSQGEYNTAKKPLFAPSKCNSLISSHYTLDVSYKELMQRVKKNPKLDLALSAYPNEITTQPLSVLSVVSAPTEESQQQILKELPKKLNKIEQTRESLIHWIFDCNAISHINAK